MKRPWRSPIEIPDLVRKHVEGKIFCEIGCGEGDLLLGFAKYAKKAYGMEGKNMCFPALKKLEKENKNIEIIYNYASTDPAVDDIPKADVYFFWNTQGTDEGLIKKIEAGTFITQRIEKRKPWFDTFFSQFGECEYIYFNPKEEYVFEGGPPRRGEGQVENRRKNAKNEDPHRTLILGILKKS